MTALPSGVLQIYDAGPEDAGNYRCVAATVAHKRKSMEASLTIIPGTMLTWFLFVYFLTFLGDFRLSRLLSSWLCSVRQNFDGI